MVWSSILLPVATMPTSADLNPNRTYNRLLLLVAGLGGLLYGVDVGIIGGALPYLEATSGLNASQLSIIVAAVLLGSVISTLFAGLLADWLGRKPLMVISGAIFVLSIPVIALSHGFGPLFLGPPAARRQRRTGGHGGSPLPGGVPVSPGSRQRHRSFPMAPDPGHFLCGADWHLLQLSRGWRSSVPPRRRPCLSVKDQAWRRIFWMSMPPGILFLVGSLFVAESPAMALPARTQGTSPERAASIANQRAGRGSNWRRWSRPPSPANVPRNERALKDSLLQRKYVLPFLLACVILFCNTATGINSIIGYNTDILLQSGLSDLHAHWGYVLFTFVNFLMTIVGMTLVDRKGRKFLFTLGTSGIIVCLLFVGILFLRTEKNRYDVRDAIQSLVGPDQNLLLHFDQADAKRLLPANTFAGASRTGCP